MPRAGGGDARAHGLLARRPRVKRLAAALHGELRAADAVAPLAVEGLTVALLAEVGRCASPATEARTPHWARLARDYVEANFRRPLRLTPGAYRALHRGLLDSSGSAG